MNKSYAFLAQISLLTDVPYPKTCGVRSGYRPHHQFFGLEFSVSGIHYYADNQWHFPGENLKTYIKILNWACVQDFVHIRTGFWINEGSQRVGVGVVTASHGAG